MSEGGEFEEKIRSRARQRSDRLVLGDGKEEGRVTYDN